MARKSIAVETKAEVPEEWKRKADGDVLEGVVALPDHKKQRKEWACALRKLLSPPDMLHEDGTIKQVYFRPKKVVIHQPRRWGEDEKRKLIEGLALYGVGGWRDIKSKLLPKWDENTLRVKSCRLIGCQNLKRYASWKPTRNQIEEAFKKNKKLGSSLGCWKAGMLVDNDNKDVEKALEKMGGKS
ncbi:hypothetical protein A3770_12p66540 [Chloropicon primus]|uniref:Myb-like domain-containing protein n=1 Tax=Chloropicon primus TaxID=1764295 RepID=A0A5B8MV23_9CHLO|nr:hypothetical protein A3770_12p66540 [Chloropicon primus]|mmetsp:Transcript_2198/g.5997  ORF Transcript_2198/g.5997 Transcript_2198/m.5997 type:complete len:185 (+) Transcript_2198:384-938(+)|eukprot:QDZ24136.1 hypothetical protein A3770_12p66540 [Chloropicon primus]